MQHGPSRYLWLIIGTAWRHSFHAAHSILLAIIILAGLLTSIVPRIEVLVDLHGWQVAAIVLGSVISVRLLLAPYWIWVEDRKMIEGLRILARANKLSAEDRAAKETTLDEIANEISWAINNLVNPKPYPLGAADPSAALDTWEAALNAWISRVSNKLANRDVFTAGDQTHFEHLGFVQVVHMTQNVRFDHLLSQLNLRLHRLREVEHRARERARVRGSS